MSCEIQPARHNHQPTQPTWPLTLTLNYQKYKCWIGSDYFVLFYNYIHIISAGWPNIFSRAGDSIEVKRSRWETNLNIDTHALLQKGKWDGKSLKISHRQSWSKVHKKVTRLHHRRHHHHQQHSVADFLKTQFAIFRQNFVGSCYFFLVVVANCNNARIQRRKQSFSLIYNTHYFDSCIDDILVYTSVILLSTIFISKLLFVINSMDIKW